MPIEILCPRDGTERWGNLVGKGNRNNRGHKEFSEIQRLKHEIQKLKRENSRLQKVLDRIDIERFNSLKELVSIQAKESKAEESTRSLDKLKEKWACFECGAGYLRLKIFPKWDGDYYYRCCSNEECGHKTKAQKYSESIEGVTE